MNDLQSTEFLKLLKVSFDQSTNVIRAFTNVYAIDSRNGGTLNNFLEKHKHDYFHQLKPFAVCCGCRGKYKSRKNVDKWIYDKVYKADSTIKCREKSKLTSNEQIHYCICGIVPLSNNLDQLDISVLLSLLYQHGIKTNSLDELREVRNVLCHAHSTQCFDAKEFDSIWDRLEKAMLDLADQVDTYLCRAIKDDLKLIRKAHFDIKETLKLKMQLHNISKEIIESNDSGQRVVEGRTLKMIKHLSKDLQDIKIVEGCDARFELWTTDKENVEWFKGDSRIEMSDKYVMETSGHMHSLVVTSADLTDRGIYTAKLLVYTRSARLDIEEYYTKNMKKGVVSIEGNCVELSCEVLEDNVPAVWEKNGVVLQQSTKYNLKDTGKSHTIAIIHPDLHDAGYYCIKVNNRIRTTCLQVYEYFTRNLETNVECFERDKVNLLCEVLDTDATAEWSKDGVVVQNSKKYEITKLGKTHTLSITNAEFQDAGAYAVKINNRVRSTKLHVKDLPEAVKRMSEEEKHQFIELIKSGVKTEKRYSFRTVIVGKHGAGKTCLRRRLMKETRDDILKTNNSKSKEDGQPQSSTDGVDIDVRSSRIPIRDGEVVQNRDWIVDGDKSFELDHRLSMVYAKTTKTDTSNTPKSTVTISSSPTTIVEPTPTTMVKPSPATIAELPPTTMVESGKKKTLVKLTECHEKSPEVNNQSKLKETMAEEKHEDNVLKSMEFKTISKKGAQHLGNDDTPEEKLFDDDTEIHLLNLIENMTIEMPLKRTEDEYAFSTLWDLSGQKEFYATHQVFLTCAAIYLLTVDLSDDLKKRFKPDSQYHFKDFQDVGEYIEFWLDSIHCYSSVRTAAPKSFIEPHVFVVCTHADKYETRKALKERQDEFESYFWELSRGQAKGKHIDEDIIYISNTTDLDERFADLRRKISADARSMKAWGEEIPQKWILLEKAIEQIRTKLNVVRLSFILKVGKLNIVGIDNAIDIKLFLRYQHEIGNIIFFNEKHLEEFVIVNPTLLIDAFKCIVSHKISNDIKQTEDWGNLKETGIMTDSLLDKLLEKVQGLNVPRTKVHVVRCLEKFDVLIPLGDRKSFYVPSMMRKMELSNLMKEIMTDPSNWKKTSWLVLKFDFLPPQFFQHIIAFFAKKFIPNDRNGKTDLYRGIGLFNLGPKKSPEKLAMCVSLHMIAMQGWVCTSNDRDFKENYRRIRLLLEKIVLRIKRRYSLNIHYLIEFRNLLNHDRTDDCVALEHLVYLDSCGSLYNSGDTNYNPREIYDKWYTESHNRKNTDIICLRHNLEWTSTFNVFLKKIEYWNVCSIDTVCTCYDAHDKVWNNVSKEHIAVAHEVYKKSEEFRTSTDCRNVSVHEEFYSKLLEKDMFLGHNKSSADRLIYVLFIENRGFKKCEYDDMFTWNIFDYLKGTEDEKFNQICHICNKESSVYWCDDCQRSMCKDCNNQHGESDQTMHHIVQHVQDKYTLDYKVELNVQIIIDVKMLNDGLLIVGDWGGKQLVTLQISRQEQPNFISLPDDPYRIAVVDNNTVAVTLPKIDALVVVDVRKKEEIQRLDVKVGTGGIIYRDNQLFVCHSKTIKIINMSGVVTSTIALSVNPRYIYDGRGGHIYCTDEDKLHCLDKDGKHVFTLGDPDMKVPVGISIDDEEQLLVVSEKSKNVLRISPDGKHSQIIITQLPLTYWFPYILYDSLSRSIVISTDKTVYVYKKV